MRLWKTGDYMKKLSVKKGISLILALSMALVLTAWQSGAVSASAASGELGTQQPAITASYLDSQGNPCNGNALPAGRYTMVLSVSDLASVSQMEFTASYDTDILSFSLIGAALLSDSLPQLDGIGPLTNGGRLIFGLASKNSDKTVLPNSAAQLLSIGITVSSQAPVDMENVITVDSSPRFTFIEVDYGDIHETESGTAYDCYALSSPAGFSGTVYPMTCDLSPDIAQYYSVSAYVGALASPDDEYGSYHTTGAVVTVSTESGDISAVTDDSGRFTLENLPNGEYTAVITYKYGFSREFEIVVDGADIDSDVMIGIVGCNWDGNDSVNTADYSLYSNFVGVTINDENYDKGFNLDNNHSINTADYSIYSSFVGVTTNNINYSYIVLN